MLLLPRVMVTCQIFIPEPATTGNTWESPRLYHLGSSTRRIQKLPKASLQIALCAPQQSRLERTQSFGMPVNPSKHRPLTNIFKLHIQILVCQIFDDENVLHFGFDFMKYNLCKAVGEYAEKWLLDESL